MSLAVLLATRSVFGEAQEPSSRAADCRQQLLCDCFYTFFLKHNFLTYPVQCPIRYTLKLHGIRVTLIALESTVLKGGWRQSSSSFRAFLSVSLRASRCFIILTKQSAVDFATASFSVRLPATSEAVFSLQTGSKTVSRKSPSSLTRRRGPL